MTTIHVRLGWVVAAVVVLLAAGCSSSTSGDAPKGVVTSSPSASASASATPTNKTTTSGGVSLTLPPGVSAADQQVLTDYARFWRVLVADLKKPSPAAPGLSTVTARAAQQYFQNALRALALKKQTQRGPVGLHPRVLARSATSATVRDCTSLSKFRILSAAGKPINPYDGRATTITVGMVRQAGHWLVVGYQEGARGCSTAGS